MFRATRLVNRVRTLSLRQVRCTAAEAGESAPQLPTKYPSSLNCLHWIIGGGVLGCFGLVEYKNRFVPKEDSATIGQLMLYHKSIGVVLLPLVGWRIFIRLTSKMPGYLPGSSSLEHMASNVVQFMQYAFLVAMPVTGYTMGIMGGKGLPLFGYASIPGVKEPNKKCAGGAYKLHKKMGKVFEAFTAVHAGAAFYHAFRGQAIFARVGLGGAVPLTMLADSDSDSDPMDEDMDKKFLLL